MTDEKIPFHKNGQNDEPKQDGEKPLLPGEDTSSATNSSDSDDEKKQHLDNIAELSKMTKRLYLLYVSAVMYCLLVVFGTTDRQIIMNEPVQLPVLSYGLPLSAFLVIGPILIFLLYAYFVVYFHRLTILKLESLKKSAR